MNHWERIEATMAGEETDRPPFCLWRHWPVADHRAETLAEAIVRWQEMYQCDLVKHAPAGSYVIEDWGGATEYVAAKDPGLGIRVITKRGVEAAEEWPSLAQLDVNQGHLGEQLKGVGLVAERLGGRAPLLQTIFSPINVAPKLAGDQAFDHMRRRPALFKQGLQIIAETTARFAKASLDAGADGFFFVAPANRAKMSEAEYREFGEPYDRLILDRVRAQSKIIMVLALGEDTMFDLLASYPVDGLNWPDRIHGPTLSEALTRFDGLLMGGIDERSTLLNGPVEAIEAQIKEAIRQTNGRRLVVGPGSTPLISTPSTHFRAARQAIRKLSI
jgi:uroporphyrinogen decarboxylase